VAHLLMIESWLGSAGAELPRTIHRRGDRFTLLARDPSRYHCHPAALLATDLLIADTHDLRAASGAALAAHRAEPFDGVVTTCDHHIATVAEIAAVLGLAGAPANAAHLALDKGRVRVALERAGVPNPMFSVAATTEDAHVGARRIGFPLIAKPLDLHSGTLVRRIDDPDSLSTWLSHVTAIEHNTLGQRRTPGVLLEAMMSGPEVSVETATFDGRTTVIGITDKSVTAAPAFVESGHQFPAPLDASDARAASQLACDALAAIGWTHGIAHTEVMLTGDGPRIVEINPRQGGNHIFELIRMVTGRSTLDALIDLALGQSPMPPEPQPDRPLSAAIQFVLAPHDGKLQAVRGTEQLEANTRVTRWSLPTELPRTVHHPRDNEDYLGHVIALDPHGLEAREQVEQAVAGLRLVMDDGREVMPLT
jgi:biotin carboxylase